MSLDANPATVQTTSPGKTERQREIYEESEVRKRTWKARNEMVMNNHLRKPLKTIVIALWSFIGQNDFCWPKQQTLAKRCGYGPNSVGALQAKLYELRKLGVIEIEKHLVSGSWRSNKYRIDFDQLAEFCDSPPPLPEAEPREHWTTKPPPASSVDECIPVPSLKGTGYLPAKVPGTSAERYLSTSRNCQLTATEPSDEWAEAAAALEDFGIQRIREAISTAAAAGLSPDRIRGLLDVAKSAGRTSAGWRITAGMVYDRIRTHRSTLSDDAGWHPDAMESLKLARQRAAASLASERIASAELANRAKAKAERDARDAEAAKHSPLIIDLSEADFTELCAAASLDVHQLRAIAKHGRTARAALPALAKALKAKDQKEDGALSCAKSERGITE